MKQIHCPLNGWRNIDEFVHGGEVIALPDPATCTDDQWTDYLFAERNRPEVVREWWCHRPTSYWFIAERHTATDEILRTYPASELFEAPE